MATKELYQVCKDWADKKSSIGTYSILNNAKKACDRAGEEYHVFNGKGEIIYPISEIEQLIAVMEEKESPIEEESVVIKTLLEEELAEEIPSLMPEEEAVPEEKVEEPEPPREEPAAATPVKEIYRVRKSWTDERSHVGSYSKLENAKVACEKAGRAYCVFNSAGEMVYPIFDEAKIEASKKFKKGDAVRLITGSNYSNGKPIPKGSFEKVMYVRDIYNTGDILIGSSIYGASLGTVEPNSLIEHDDTQPLFASYVGMVIVETADIRSEPRAGSKLLKEVRRNHLYTVIDEKDEWARLKIGGWIKLDTLKKL